MPHTTGRRGWLPSAAVLAAVLAVVAGCDGGVKRVPVSGTVMLDGQPLTGGILHFAPDVSKGNEHRIDCLGPVRNGKFNLMTQAILQRDNGSGVPPGWYKVYLFVDPTVPTLNVNVLPQFTSAERTPLSVEVVENPPPGAYDFKMTSK